ncbi:FtsQ-type POTRA domain-containing protein [Clostridium sp.]|uniref:cell division protein FtsQ/DivIB n=1 Tax=Clostridium sp. TaxID=1506 RepID=UPI002FCA8EDE
MKKVEKKNEYGKYILQNKDAILKKKRKLRTIKRSILTLVVLFSILVTLCFNLDYFNTTEIKVSANSNVTSDEIIALSQLKKGDNIFKFKVSNVRKNVLKNPYILDLKVNRVFPSNINIEVVERKATFYISYNDSFYVIDNNAIILEKRDTVEGMNLVRLEGVDLSTVDIGKSIPLNGEEKKRVLTELCEFIYNDNAVGEHVISMIQLNDFIDINIVVDNLTVKLGTSEKVKEKLTRAFSIIKDEQFAGIKGYVDVSFDGNPVIYREE